VSGTLTFAAGVTSLSIAVPVVPDTVAEPTESFTVILANAVNATMATGTGVVTILDEDGGTGGPVTLTLNVASGDGDVNEQANVLESGSSMWMGNAAASGSYAATRFGNVSIPRGASITSAHLEVRAASTAWTRIAFEFAGDASGNSAAFSGSALPSQRPLTAARVSHLSDAQWVANTWYTLDEIAPIIQEVVNRADWNPGSALSIVMRGTGFAWGRKFAQAYEGDPASAPRLVVTFSGGGPVVPALTINDVSVAEGTGGTAAAVFTVTLSASPTQPVTVAYATANGTAVAPGDYTAASGTLTFGAGVTTQTLSIALVTDSVVEPNETFSVLLSNPVNATIADGTGVATIVNDDAGGGALTASFQIGAGADDVNQDGTALAATGSTLWVGNGSAAASSYAGLRFQAVSIPRNATITSARLEVNASATAWIGLGFEFGIEAVGNSAAFSAASLPSQRPLLAARVTHASNQQWTANAWVTLDDITPIVQELVNRGDWAAGNALGLILRGTSGAWARKWVHTFEGAPLQAPRLVVTYTVP
jgi:hypothetical protein